MKIKNNNKRLLGSKLKGVKTRYKVTTLLEFIESEKFLQWVIVGCNYINSDYHSGKWDPIFDENWNSQIKEYSDIIKYFMTRPITNMNTFSAIVKWINMGVDFIYKSYVDCIPYYTSMFTISSPCWEFFQGFKNLSIHFDESEDTKYYSEEFENEVSETTVDYTELEKSTEDFV